MHLSELKSKHVSQLIDLATEAYEFQQIYGLETVVIPTHRPAVRKDQQDQIYRTDQEKYKAIVADIRAQHAAGRPILVGTTSIENSELLSDLLKREKLEHQVLNAKQHEREAEIVAQAGKPGMITVDSQGQRYLNESTSYHLFGIAMQAHHATTPSVPSRPESRPSISACRARASSRASSQRGALSPWTDSGRTSGSTGRLSCRLRNWLKRKGMVVRAGGTWMCATCSSGTKKIRRPVMTRPLSPTISQGSWSI